MAAIVVACTSACVSRLPFMEWIPAASRCPSHADIRFPLWLYSVKSRRVMQGRYQIADVDEFVENGWWLDLEGKQISGTVDFWKINDSGEVPEPPQ